MKVLTIAALAAAVPTHAAYAHEPEPKHAGRDAAAEPGFRVEVLGGYDSDGYYEGVVYGGSLGYDFRAGRRVLLGVDGEVNTITTHARLRSPTQSLDTENGPEIYVGARATVVLSSRIRLYGTGGYSRMKQGNFVLIDPDPGPFGTFTTIKRSYGGFRLGAGAQFLIGRRAFIAAEHRFSDYGNFGLRRSQIVGSLGLRF